MHQSKRKNANTNFKATNKQSIRLFSWNSSTWAQWCMENTSKHKAKILVAKNEYGYQLEGKKMRLMRDAETIATRKTRKNDDMAPTE